MPNPTLEELAVRVEQAEGADRELDAEIAFAAGLVWDRQGSYFHGHDGDFVLERDYYSNEGSPPELSHFTRSVDAALSLVPEGWRVQHLGEQQQSDDHGDYLGYWSVRLHWPDGGRRDNLKWGKGSSTALALCAAALRARSASLPPETAQPAVGVG